MQRNSSHAHTDYKRPRPPFRRRPNRHPGLAEHDAPRTIPVPKGEIPEVFASSVFGTLAPLLQHAIAEAGYLTPTPIQEKAIPYVMEKRDLIGCAQTGTGKTAAFLLPVLHHLLTNEKTVKPGHPRALILAPTRELAAQIAQNCTQYSRFTGTPFAVVFGGVSQFPQVKALERGATIVIATPGRLLDLMQQGCLSLDCIETFILDEADRMLDMGFLPDIRKIIAALPKERHALFFSATLAPEVMHLAKDLVHDPVQIMISPETPTVEKINQKIMFVDKANKDALLLALLNEHPEYRKIIIFSRTRHGADRIEKKLRKADILATAIHSDKSQNARTHALDAFRSGNLRALVATDIASRGIDVEGVTHVINIDLPEESESYIHRIGRTARAGADGAAISFVSAEERGLLRGVERLIKKTIDIDRDQPFHSEAAENASGKAGKGLPRPPWRNGSDAKGGYKRPHGAPRAGGSGLSGEERPKSPRKGGSYWSAKTNKKHVHPANAKRARNNRTNFQGRRQNDFGQGGLD